MYGLYQKDKAVLQPLTLDSLCNFASLQQNVLEL